MKKVVIDAGHGGNDGGAVGNGIIEKEYTLKISDYIHKRLDELGIENTMTRTTDETLSPEDRVKRVLGAYGNGNDILVVSNHINAGGGDGAEVIYALRNSDMFSKKVAMEIENAGQNVRKYYQIRLPSNPNLDYYFMLRDTPNTEAVIVEYGFLDSSSDDVNQLKKNWQRYAEAVVKAIANYVGVPYSSTYGDEYYTVKSGYTLWSIANKFDISVSELKSLNNLSSNLLSIGQKLQVTKGSQNSSDTNYYIVKSGDTLYSIARKYGLTVDKLKSINNLNSSNLSIGQKLYIGASENVENSPIIDSNINDSYDTYIVKSGDSLWSIASRYNTTVDNLKSINNISSNLLSIGQKLLVPMVASRKYMVVAGDNLYKIARSFNTTVSEIMALNNLNTSNLSIGQVLLIP